MYRPYRLPIAVALVTLLSSCKREIVPEPYVPTSAHDGYLHSLRESALLETALGRDWQQAAEAAVSSPIEVRAPFEETFYIDRAEAFATGYEFSVKRGQRTEVQLTVEPPSDWRLFVDLFRAAERDGEGPVHVASGGEGDLRLAFEPRRDGNYVLRIQSELLRGGRCTVQIRNVASLEFPVAGRDTSAIGSDFGAPREAGRRSHHGVDIFAPRHTEVRATSRARVRRVDDWKLGGRVIWLEDPERNLRLYFAHLQTQDVIEGTWVGSGDKIGTVGNSGNARTTPPHLHFGVYVAGEGPVDPHPFLFQPRQTFHPVSVDLDRLGTWVRTKSEDVPLYGGPSRRGNEPLQDLPTGTPLRVLGGSERSYRVRLPNGVHGYVSARATETLDPPLESIDLVEDGRIHDRPSPEAAVVRTVAKGTPVKVLGRFEAYALVPLEGTRPRWLRLPGTTPPSVRTAP